MRQLTLLGAFFVLVAMVFFLWQYRFERSPDFPAFHLSDLRPHSTMGPGAEWVGQESDPKLKLRVDPANAHVAARMEFPGISAVRFLKIRLQVSASKLVPGQEIWNDGRCIIEWHPENGGKLWENDQFTSIRHDQTGVVTECVLRPESGSAVPALRIENLGASGEMELSMFEAIILRERAGWKAGCWLLMLAWIVWVAVWIGPAGKHRFIRPVLAGCVWLVMGIYFVVPGPWKILHPLGPPFQIGPEIENVQKPARPAVSAFETPSGISASPTPALQTVGRIPDKGDFTLRLKHYAANARPLLHSFLLFAPALAIACLVGLKKMVPLMVVFALAIETAQFSFGYGFDWVDVFDLFCDAVGIALAIAAHRRLMRIKLPDWMILMDSGAEQALALEQ